MRMAAIKFSMIAGVGAIAGCLCARPAAAPKSDSAVQPAQVVAGVRSVPPYPIFWPDMPAGPNKDIYLANCVACHSQLYVLMQPPFPRSTWTAEVLKMKQSYGASIDDAQMPRIVDYLVSIRGVGPAAKKD